MLRFPSQLGIGEAFPKDLPHRIGKAVLIVHRPAIVEAKRLFIDVPKQVIRFNADIGAAEGAFQETPEILHTVCMNVAVYVSAII